MQFLAKIEALDKLFSLETPNFALRKNQNLHRVAFLQKKRCNNFKILQKQHTFAEFALKSGTFRLDFYVALSEVTSSPGKSRYLSEVSDCLIPSLRAARLKCDKKEKNNGGRMQRRSDGAAAGTRKEGIERASREKKATSRGKE